MCSRWYWSINSGQTHPGQQEQSIEELNSGKKTVPIDPASISQDESSSLGRVPGAARPYKARSQASSAFLHLLYLVMVFCSLFLEKLEIQQSPSVFFLEKIKLHFFSYQSSNT